jgi:hypothetical protein
VLTAPEVINALENVHRDMATGQAINSPPYRVFTPRRRDEYGPQFPEDWDPIHHAFTSPTGAIATWNIVCDRVDSDIITAVRGADFVITATNAPEPVVLADWLEPGQFVTGVKDLELELGAWERCDVLTANRHGPMRQRYAIGGVEVIPEYERDYWGQPSRIQWEALLLPRPRHRHPRDSPLGQQLGDRAAGVSSTTAISSRLMISATGNF